MTGPFASPPGAPRPLAGRVALVTGAFSGVGLDVARALAAEGADIVLNGRADPQEIATLEADLISAFGVLCVSSSADLASLAEIEAMFDEITAHGPGRLDILVNSAGAGPVLLDAGPPAPRWDRILALNLSAAVHTMRLAIPLMRQGGYGRIVNIASAPGLMASPFRSAYVAAKHELIGLTRAAALKTADEPITCNAICPRDVRTPAAERRIDDQAGARGVARDGGIYDVLSARRPTKRCATAEEMGALTAFLCSLDALSITGAALPVDGGWTAH